MITPELIELIAERTAWLIAIWFITKGMYVCFLWMLGFYDKEG